MKIAIVGAGIVGVTSAWELGRDGHEVTVFERRGAAAEETSFANAGVVAPGYVAPWAAPGMPTKVLRYLLSRHAPVRLGLPLSAAECLWIWRWWRSCTLDSYLANRERLQRLAFYSRERLHQVSAELQLDYERGEGYMVLLRSAQDQAMAQPGLRWLSEAGVKFRQVDAAEARRIEPALNPDTTLHGAIHLPDDEVANCRQFALLLKNEAQRIGVRFEFGRTVTRLVAGQRPEVHLSDGPSPIAYDAVLICAGVDAATLLRPIGLRIPLAAVHGYSISAPLRESLNAPRSALMDERFKVAISRLGNRIRVAGSAEIGGTASQHRAASLQTLYKVLHDWFPGAARLSSGVQEWKGARPMLPDGPPLLGASGVAGIWLNLGHGSSGWALSCGSARLVADLIAARTPAIALDGLGMDRMRGKA